MLSRFLRMWEAGPHGLVQVQASPLVCWCCAANTTIRLPGRLTLHCCGVHLHILWSIRAECARRWKGGKFPSEKTDRDTNAEYCDGTWLGGGCSKGEGSPLPPSSPVSRKRTGTVTVARPFVGRISIMRFQIALA